MPVTADTLGVHFGDVNLQRDDDCGPGRIEWASIAGMQTWIYGASGVFTLWLLGSGTVGTLLLLEAYRCMYAVTWAK